MNGLLSAAKQQLEHELMVTKNLEEKIKVRDAEILRLHDLYLPAQNLEKLNIKYTYEESQKAIKKLEEQVNFLNRENAKLSCEVNVFKESETGSIACK